MAFQSFSVKTVATQTASSLDHGVEYPAIIAGLWNATTEWQGKEKHGMYMLILLKDNNDKYVFRGLFFGLDGYVLGQRAAYARVMQGLLRCSDSDGILKEKITAAGLDDLTSLIGRPCLARISVREKGDKSWASVETVSGETARFHGLDMPKLEDIEPVDIEKVAGKFTKIVSVDDCMTIPTLRVLGRSTNPSSGRADAEPIFRDNMEDAMF